jgi:hemolysin activation/secretion protein
MSIRLVLAGFSVLLTAALGSAFAQAIPASSDPARLPDRVMDAPRLPRSAPVVIEPDKGSVPSGAEKLRFKMRDLTLKGLTVYEASDLEGEWRHMLGQEIGVDQIFALAAKLTARYRGDGYILSQVVVPRQKIQSGRVTLEVVEGYLSDVQFEGDGLPASLKEEQSSRLKASRPLKADVMERALLLFRSVPGMTTTSILQPAPGAKTGASVLTIQVKRKAYDVMASADNRGSRAIGPWQASTGAWVNGAAGMGERFGARIIATPQHELRAVQADAEWMFGADGTLLRMIGYRGESWPGARSAAYDIHGFTDSVSAILSHPFMLGRDTSLWVDATLSSANSRTNMKDRLNSEDAVRALRAAMRYTGLDPLGGAWTSSAEISRGLNALGASEPGTKLRARRAAEFEFLKLNIDLGREQALGDGWSFYMAASAQWSRDPLPSSEQFGFGGSRYGRAYDPSAALGDRGAAGSLELRYSFAPGVEGLQLMQLYAFSSAARLYVDQHEVKQTPEWNLADFGVGLRLWGTQGLTSTLEIAKPLTRRPDATATESGRSLRIGLSLRWDL